MRPASYQDFLDGKTLYYRRTRYNAHLYANEFTPVRVTRAGPMRSSMIGDYHTCAYFTEGSDYPITGKLFVYPFRTASQFRIETSCDPYLWVAE